MLLALLASVAARSPSFDVKLQGGRAKDKEYTGYGPKASTGVLAVVAHREARLSCSSDVDAQTQQQALTGRGSDTS